MPDLAPLHDRSREQLDLDEALHETVAEWMRTAGTDRAAAKAEVEDLAEQLADATDDEAAIRTELAAADTPADVSAGEEALRTALVDAAALRPRLRDARRRVAAAELLLAGLGPVLDAERRNEDTARARLKLAKDWEDRGLAVTSPDAVTTADELATSAGEVLASSEFGDAEARVAELIPEELRDRATARLAAGDEEHTWWTDRAAAAAASLAELERDAGPGDHDLAEATLTFETALRALENHLADGPRAVTRAEAAAADAVALDPLTPAESDRLTDTATPGELTTEQAIDDALAAWRTGATTVDEAVLEAIEDSPDAAPADDGNATAARDALAPLRTAVTDAVDAHDAAALAAWEVEVRPEAWAARRTLLDARASLETIADSAHASGLRDALVAASTALADAIAERGSAGRRLVRMQLEAVVRHADARAGRSGHAEARAGRHRGDGVAGLGPSQLDPSLHA